jgi:hypothetical protein
VRLQHVWILIFFAISGALLCFFGCRLLETNGIRWACLPLLFFVLLVVMFLTVGTRHTMR